MLASAQQDDDVDVGIFVRTAKRIVQFFQQHPALGVAVFGPIRRDPGYLVLDFIKDR